MPSEPSVVAAPAWTASVLACPACHATLADDGSLLRCCRCGDVGQWRDGIVCFGVPADDPSIAWYESVGGTRFHERAQIGYTMSSLDTPVYHHYLESVRPEHQSSVIVDLGAGDGRNVEPWLRWGYRRVVAVDAIASSLVRFRTRMCKEHPEWLDRVLLIQADVRRLPLVTGSAACATAIETLIYLNEDYGRGLVECRRVLTAGGRLLSAERCWEGALLIHLLYGGVKALCQLSASRDAWDGEPGHLVRSRSFTEEELLTEFARAGFEVLETKGVPVLSVVLGYLRGQNKLSGDDEAYLPQVRQCLQVLAERGALRKAHVVIARPVSGER
jgi:ubiquinone/menaquinone biosynthesis C-methylase UbiE